MPKIIIADDHPMITSGLSSLLSMQAALQDYHIACVDNASALLAQLDQAPCQLLILDLDIPGAKGTSLLATVSKQFSALPIIVLSANTGVDIAQRCANRGAWAYLPKSTDPMQILDRVLLTLQGERLLYADDSVDVAYEWDERVASLTKKQREIYAGVIEGKLNKQIAFDLNISETTVKSHMTAIFEKLQVRDRKQLIVAAQAD